MIKQTPALILWLIKVLNKIRISVHVRSFSFWQTMYLTPQQYAMAADDIYRLKKIEHENVHVRRQGKGLLNSLVWVAKYFTSKDFRREEEAGAYVSEIAFIVLRDETNDDDLESLRGIYTAMMIASYWGAFTEAQANAVVDDGLACGQMNKTVENVDKDHEDK